MFDRGSFDAASRRMLEAIRQHGYPACVRNKSFITPLQNYCRDELAGRLVPNPSVTVDTEVDVFLAVKQKKIDVVMFDHRNGPLLTLGVRSQLNSIGNNIQNYVEEIVEETRTIKERFPLCLTSYVYLLPLSDFEGDQVDHEKWENFFYHVKKSTGVFDRLCYLVIDFKDFGRGVALVQPELREQNLHPELSIDSFFDGLVSDFKERNWFLNVFR